ncbi:MAG: glycosyltransferase family 9 protein [bacterium]
MASTSREKILVMRFSALGDVALTIPVLKAFLELNRDKELVMLSNQQFSGLFEGIERLSFIGADLKHRHKGFIGIFRIFNMVRKQVEFSTVVDLHSVIRTYLLRCLFTVLKKRTAGVKKSRFENYALTRKENKVFRPLPHATDRYIKVFQALGFSVAPISTDIITNDNRTVVRKKIKIGFAPFAQHNHKMYNLDKFKEIVKHFDKTPYKLYFFGGAVAEKLLIERWEKEFKQAVAIDRSTGLNKELTIISELDVMISMDSANMHLASLVNVPVVSIWGPTHPFSGFYGLHQNPLNAVQVNDLSCRPCSVFGSKPCWRGDHACMQQITPSMVIEKVESMLVNNAG